MLTAELIDAILKVMKDQYVANKMNKWLREVEIKGTNSSFGKEKCRQFVDDTRPLVDGLYQTLKRTVRSRYGKVVLSLWSQSRLDEVSIPFYEYDTMGGVCKINRPFDLDNYLSIRDKQERHDIVYKILKDTFANLPEDMGLDGDEVMVVVDQVCRDMPRPHQ